MSVVVCAASALSVAVLFYGWRSYQQKIECQHKQLRETAWPTCCGSWPIACPMSPDSFFRPTALFVAPYLRCTISFVSPLASSTETEVLNCAATRLGASVFFCAYNDRQACGLTPQVRKYLTCGLGVRGANLARQTHYSLSGCGSRPSGQGDQFPQPARRRRPGRSGPPLRGRRGRRAGLPRHQRQP